MNVAISALRELHDALADGEITGEALAERFGVTRSAMHKRIEALRDWGVAVEAQAGRGYRLVRPIEWLESATVSAALSAEARQALAELRIETEVDSSNARLLAMPAPARGVRVLAAERQSAGRGRRGRVWHSAPGGSLTFSLSLRVDSGVAALQGLSLAVGIVLCEALRRCGVTDAALKWPNDIWVRDRKLAGILIEIDGDAAGPLQAVVGVGLNWCLTPEQREHIDQAVTDTLSEGAAPGRNRLFAALLDGLLPLLDDYPRTGFAPWWPRWDAVDALRGRTLQAQLGPNVLDGVAEGIRADGALILRCADRLRYLHGGEITVRPR